MALTKVEYTDYQTVIGAANLNAIQDEIIGKCVTVESKTFGDTAKATARANIGAVSSTEVATAVNAGKVLVVSGTVSSSSPTLSNSKITTDMVCINAVIGTPSAQTADWTINTDTAGAATISPASAIGSSTTVTLYLMSPQS